MTFHDRMTVPVGAWIGRWKSLRTTGPDRVVPFAKGICPLFECGRCPWSGWNS